MSEAGRLNLLTQRNDNGRTGVNGAETVLSPKNVDIDSFGRVHTVAVGRGAIYAQPLYVQQLASPDGTRHDTVIVATMQNHLVAIDANSGKVLVDEQVDGKPAVPTHKYFGGNYNDFVNAGGEVPSIGILSTPVIDLPAGEIYVVLLTVDAAVADAPTSSDADCAAAFQYILYALDLRTFRPKRKAVISGSVSGTGYHSSARALWDAAMRGRIKLMANGDLTVRTRFTVTDVHHQPVRPNGVVVTDATGIGSHDPRVHFNAMMQLQRPGLLLADGIVYIGFGSRGDMDPWHGWVCAYRGSDLTRVDLLCTTPNGAQGGIWQAGQGLIADAQGYVYAGTGNGDSKQVAGLPGTPNMGESFLKLRLDNQVLDVSGWYNAFNDLDYRSDDDNDEVEEKDDDLGASAPALLPDGRIVGGGKDGYFYLIDGDQLVGDAAARQQQPKADAVVQQYFLASYNFERGTHGVATNVIPQPAPVQATHHIHGAPVVWHADAQLTCVYVWGENDVARAYRYVTRTPGQPLSGGFPSQGAISVAPLITADWQHVIPNLGVETARGTVVASNEYPGRNGMPGGFVSLSWDGRDPASAILWGLFPPYKNGNVWRVDGELVAYDASDFDVQPDFSRMKSIWRSSQDPADRFKLPKFCCPSIADGKVFVPSGDGSVLSIYGIKPGAVRYDLSRDGQNSVATLNGLRLNGSARIGAGGFIVLTDNPIPPNNLDGNDQVGRAFVPTFQSGSAFCRKPADVTNLTVEFTAQLVAVDPNNMADGFGFAVQAVGDHALGSSGSGLGYATDLQDTTRTGARIARSLAVVFSVVTNTVSVWRDGVQGGPWVHDLGTNAIALNNGHPIDVRLQFATAARTLVITVTDLQSPNSATGPLTLDGIDLPTFLKLPSPPLAYVGFTGGTGAKSAEQRILNVRIG